MVDAIFYGIFPYVSLFNWIVSLVIRWSNFLHEIQLTMLKIPTFYVFYELFLNQNIIKLSLLLMHYNQVPTGL
jgi:hypothetical protein